jgi:hypothetical protein
VDFEIALYISGTITAIILIFTLFVFAVRIRRVFPDVTKGTRNALLSFGASGIMTAVVVVTGLYFRGLFMAWMGFFFAFLVNSIIYILYPEGRRASYARIGMYLLAFAILVENLFEFLPMLPDMGMYLRMIGLTVFIVGAFLLAGILIRETPSAFTGSFMLILIFYLVTAFTASTYLIFDNPEYFIIQSLPILVSAAVFGSVNRPWRTMVSLFVVFLAVAMAGGLIVGAVLVGEWTTVWFTTAATIAGLSLVAPLNYFIGQAVVSGGRTPQFIAVVLVTVSILTLTHVNSFAIWVTQSQVWNEFFVWSDVFLGSIAIIAFLLAGASAAFGEGTYIVARELSVMFGTTMIVLGFPIIRGWPGESWQASTLYPFLGIAMAIGVLLFVRTAYALNKAGARRAAQNLMTFMFAALIIGIIAMFSDQIPLIVTVMLLLVASGLAIASSPPIVARLDRTISRLDEVSTIGDQEDGSIRW